MKAVVASGSQRTVVQFRVTLTQTDRNLRKGNTAHVENPLETCPNNNPRRGRGKCSDLKEAIHFRG